MKGKRILALLCAVATVLQLALIGGPAAKAAEAVGTTAETFYYDLADGNYLVTGGGQYPNQDSISLTVNGAAVASGHTLSAPGDYTVVNKYKDRSGNTVELTQQIVMYKQGDAHPDGKYDVKDLVAMKKCEQGLPLDTKAGVMAVEGYLGKIEAGVMQTFLLSDRGAAALNTAFPESRSLSFNAGSKNVMPIGGYEGPADKANADTSGYSAAVKDYLTDQYYSVLQDAGINLILSAGHATDTPEITTQKQLSLAQKYGMRVFVGPSYLFSEGVDSVTEENLLQLLREYSGYSSMAGFTLQDEPDGSNYPSASYQDSTKNGKESAALAKLIAKYPNLTGFTNLFPWWSNLGTKEAYKSYLDEYFTNYGAGADHLCFDYYVFAQGIQTGDRTREEYFDNLEMVKEAANNRNVPFWSTIQVGNYVTGEQKKNDWLSNLLGTGEKNYMTQGLTSWNVNTSLAYGAKGITYYPLVQPYSYAAVNSGNPNYGRSGIIGANGQTNTYHTYIKNANKQIMAVDEVLMNATHKGFMTSGTASNESGVANITGNTLTSVSSNKSMGAFVGCFDYYGQNAYYVVNYDHDNEANITLTFDKAYSLRVTVDGVTGSKDAAASHTLTLTAGNAALVLLGDAAATEVTDAETAINAIPDSPSTAGYYNAVVAARSAYSALPQADRAMIPAATLDKYNHHNENTRSYEAFQAMLNALPDVFSLAVIEDIDKTEAAYNALGDWGVLVTATEKAKLDALVASRLAVTVLFNAATGEVKTYAAYTGHGATVSTAYDAQYGTVATLEYAADPTDETPAGFRILSDLSKHKGDCHFYVYNPTKNTVQAWMYRDGGDLNVTTGDYPNLLTMQPGWNKVNILNATNVTEYLEGSFTTKAVTGTWMFTSIYSVTDDAQAEIDAAPVNALIEELPNSVDEITAGNYTQYEEKLTEINTQYAALSALAQTKVDLTKVTACQERVNAIKDALGAAGEVNSLLTALPNAKDVTFKDLAAVNAAKDAFDKLDATAQAQVSTGLKDNLDACVAALDGFTLLIDAATDRLDNPSANTGYTVGRTVDPVYGAVFTLEFDNTNLAGFRLYGNLSGYTNR